jgi:uncharacterized protein
MFWPRRSSKGRGHDPDVVIGVTGASEMLVARISANSGHYIDAVFAEQPGEWDATAVSMDIMIEQGPTPEQFEIAVSRRKAFTAAIPKAVLDAEDGLPSAIAGLNASTRSKLHRIYILADEISEIRAPFVACARGCAFCCHMNVTITGAEAERLGKVIGRKPVSVSRSLRRSREHFAGQPCTFLGNDGTCSIYPDRPLACRKHASFFEDAAACRPDVMNDIEVPQVGFSGLDQALFTASVDRGEIVLADIRDFFPPAA